MHSAEPLFPFMASIYLSVFALASQCSPSPTSEVTPAWPSLPLALCSVPYGWQGGQTCELTCP